MARPFRGNAIDTKRFTWLPEERKLVAEISDLPRRGFERVYPDAADIGLRLRSDATGREAWFVVAEERRDREGDVTHWELLPAPESVREVPALAGLTVIVFND